MTSLLTISIFLNFSKYVVERSGKTRTTIVHAPKIINRPVLLHSTDKMLDKAIHV